MAVNNIAHQAVTIAILKIVILACLLLQLHPSTWHHRLLSNTLWKSSISVGHICQIGESSQLFLKVRIRSYKPLSQVQRSGHHRIAYKLVAERGQVPSEFLAQALSVGREPLGRSLGHFWVRLEVVVGEAAVVVAEEVAVAEGVAAVAEAEAAGSEIQELQHSCSTYPNDQVHPFPSNCHQPILPLDRG